jgi:hypothetical protein
MDLVTADWSAANGRDDLERYYKERRSKKDGLKIDEILKKARGMGDLGIGGSRGGGKGGDGGQRKTGSSKPPQF